MPAPERIVVEIEREEDAPTYRAAIYGLGLGSRPTLVEHLRLHREVSIPLRDLQERDVSTTLAELEKRLFPASPNDAAESLAYFDDSVQLSFGQFLFRELFASCHSQGELHRLAEREGQELRIVTKDEFLIRLPWILLASDEGISLARLKRWSVSLAARRDPLDVPLPNFPKVLIAVPEPKGPRFDATRGEEHAGVLREYLSGIDVRYGWPEYLRVVRSWADFESALGQMQPEIVYFYGHGQGDLESSGLLFENQNGSPIEVTMTQLAATLNERARGAVKLLYLNCCSGDSGGLLGAGMQLRAIVPALLTNRTFAWQVSHARWVRPSSRSSSENEPVLPSPMQRSAGRSSCHPRLPVAVRR